LAALDVIMPKLGRTAVALERKERFPDKPVIFTSGYSQGGANLLHGIGPTGTRRRTYLQKPYSPSALSKVGAERTGHTSAETTLVIGVQIGVSRLALTAANPRC